MFICNLNLSEKASNFVTLKCPGIGNFKVFSSSDAETRNRIECSHLTNATLPPGSYWIVDRPRGGVRSRMIAMIQGFVSGNDRDDWFALYRIDEKFDDETEIQGNTRSNFRIHPRSYAGTSYGCITFEHQSDYNVFRNFVLKIAPRTMGDRKVYGIVNVFGVAFSNEDC
ncbi:MAG: DUF2778 domain-containing protein [Alcaligenaceae bacterium]|nr:DUF2778 domain-containing protein [Alcaligenaceae bacterium]